MICLNCGRPNPSGTALCSRCRERRPGSERAKSGVVYPRTHTTVAVGGSRGRGILGIGVLLLAGLIFAGGTFAIFISKPNTSSSATNPGVALGSGASPSGLAIFEQLTPSPEPTGTPWFPSPSPTDISLSSPSPGLFTPLPTEPGVPTPTPTHRTPRPPTPTPKATPTAIPTPTAEPTPIPLEADFKCSQQDESMVVNCVDKSTGGPNAWHWFFGDGSDAYGQAPPPHPYLTDGYFDVTLKVSNEASGLVEKTKTIHVQAPTPTPTAEPTPSETATPATP